MFDSDSRFLFVTILAGEGANLSPEIPDEVRLEKLQASKIQYHLDDPNVTARPVKSPDGKSTKMKRSRSLSSESSTSSSRSRSRSYDSRSRSRSKDRSLSEEERRKEKKKVEVRKLNYVGLRKKNRQTTVISWCV